MIKHIFDKNNIKKILKKGVKNTDKLIIDNIDFDKIRKIYGNFYYNQIINALPNKRRKVIDYTIRNSYLLQDDNKEKIKEEEVNPNIFERRSSSKRSTVNSNVNNKNLKEKKLYIEDLFKIILDKKMKKKDKDDKLEKIEKYFGRQEYAEICIVIYFEILKKIIGEKSMEENEMVLDYIKEFFGEEQFNIMGMSSNK